MTDSDPGGQKRSRTANSSFWRIQQKYYQSLWMRFFLPLKKEIYCSAGRDQRTGLYYWTQAYEKGMMIVLNQSPYDKALETCDLKKISLFLVKNEIEDFRLQGKKNRRRFWQRSGSFIRKPQSC